MPRGPQDSHGLSTTRCPTSSPRAFGPSATTSATTSWPMTCGKEQKAAIALSASSSPKSIRICLESDPQMPVSRGRVITQSSCSSCGSGTSRSAVGVRARFCGQRVGVIGDLEGLRRHAVDERLHRGAIPADAGDERVDVGVLDVDDRLHVGDVVLERSVPRAAMMPSATSLGGDLGPLVEGFLAARLVPDLGVDRARLDQLHRDAGAVQVDGHRLAPAAQRELACAVGGFVDDPEPAADARHVDDHARPARQHPRQQGQRQPHRGEEVDPHDVLDLVRIQLGDRPPLRDRGVVDQHVDAAERRPTPAAPARRRAAVSARSATHIAESGEVRRQSASTSARRSRRRAISPTTAPRAASRRASAAPRPDEAPVMSTRLPGRRVRHRVKVAANRGKRTVVEACYIG